MKLLKYSKTVGSDGGTSTVGTRGGGSDTTFSNVELDRTIWG